MLELEADFGEDPMQSMYWHIRWWLFGGRQKCDTSGSTDAFALKVVPNNWSGYLHLSPPSEASNTTWSWSLAPEKAGNRMDLIKLLRLEELCF